jgi:type II secretory pathway pseudopilin PulG
MVSEPLLLQQKQDMSLNYKKTQSGFTLIDTIIGIVIISFVLTGILFVVIDLNVKSVRNETIAKGTVYANSVMNYIRAHRFDENYTTYGLGAPWTYPLGQESGDYDDIDDFIGADWSIIPGYTDVGYQATSNVFYVDMHVNFLDICLYDTDFKRITVTVDHSDLPHSIVLTSIMTPHGSY